MVEALTAPPLLLERVEWRLVAAVEVDGAVGLVLSP